MRQWPSSHQSKQPATWRYTLKRKLRILTEWFLDCGFARAVRVVAWREAGMAQPWPWEVEDGLWELIDPLLPKPERRFRPPAARRRAPRSSRQQARPIL